MVKTKLRANYYFLKPVILLGCNDLRRH